MGNRHQQRQAAAQRQQLDEPLLLVLQEDDEAEQQQQQQQQQQQPSLPPLPISDAAVPVLPPSPVKPPHYSPGALLQPGTTSCLGSLSAWHELQVLLVLALPTIVTTAAQQIVIIVSQVFAGRISTDAAAAAALSNTLWNLVWYVILGISTALDTLGSQSVGAGDKQGLIVWAMSGGLVLSVVTILMGVALWFAGPLAQTLFGQHPDMALLVSRFCRLLLPGLWPAAMAQLLQKYLQTQGLVIPPALTSGLSIAVNIASSCAGVELLGFDGVAWAATATRAFLLLAMFVAIAVCESRAHQEQELEQEQEELQQGLLDDAAPPACRTTSGGSNNQRRHAGCGGSNMWLQAATWRAGWNLFWHNALCLRTLWSFFKLGAPGGIALGLEAAAFEVSTAFAGFLGPVAVTAHAGVFSLTSLNYIALPFALATAATIRVGNLMGAGQGCVAAVSSKVVVALGSGFMAVCGLVLFLARNSLGLLFTAGDVEVLKAVALIAPLGALYQVGDGVLGTSQGVLRGLGRQAQLMVLNVFCFWLLAVPAGWWLAFRAQWGLQGLWTGMAIGCFTSATVSFVLMLCVNWDKEVGLTLQRLSDAVAAAAGGEAGEGLPVVGAVAVAGGYVGGDDTMAMVVAVDDDASVSIEDAAAGSSMNSNGHAWIAAGNSAASSQ